MNLPDFLTRDDNGWIHVTDHRIGLEDIVFFFRRGDSPEMLHLRFPTVAVSTMYRVIAFYLDNEKEAGAYVDDFLAEGERQRAEAVNQGPSLAELRERLAQKRLAQSA
jgi:uncharacterized protein (DUF433 family)